MDGRKREISWVKREQHTTHPWLSLLWDWCFCSFLFIQLHTKVRITHALFCWMKEKDTKHSSHRLLNWKKEKWNEEKSVRHFFSLTFSLLFTSFFLSSHSLWLMIPWWWGLVCVVCCVPFGCNGMEWSTNRTEHTTRHNPNPELVCQVQKSQF